MKDEPSESVLIRIETEADVDGIDDVLKSSVHTNHYYKAENIHFNRTFVDIMVDRDDGTRVLDFRNFHSLKA